MLTEEQAKFVPGMMVRTIRDVTIRDLGAEAQGDETPDEVMIEAGEIGEIVRYAAPEEAERWPFMVKFQRGFMWGVPAGSVERYEVPAPKFSTVFVFTAEYYLEKTATSDLCGVYSSFENAHKAMMEWAKDPRNAEPGFVAYAIYKQMVDSEAQFVSDLPDGNAKMWRYNASGEEFQGNPWSDVLGLKDVDSDDDDGPDSIVIDGVRFETGKTATVKGDWDSAPIFIPGGFEVKIVELDHIDHNFRVEYRGVEFRMPQDMLIGEELYLLDGDDAEDDLELEDWDDEDYLDETFSECPKCGRMRDIKARCWNCDYSDDEFEAFKNE